MSDLPNELVVSPPIDAEDARVFKALSKGEASPDQQRNALHILVNQLCRTHDLQYVPGNVNAGIFLSGRAFVGGQILKAVNLSADKFPSRTTNG